MEGEQGTIHLETLCQLVSPALQVSLGGGGEAGGLGCLDGYWSMTAEEQAQRERKKRRKECQERMSGFSVNPK